MLVTCVTTTDQQPAARHHAQDRQLATHVLSVHKDGRAPPPAEGPPPLSPELLRAYIAAAKQHEPHFPRDRDLTGARMRPSEPWRRHARLRRPWSLLTRARALLCGRRPGAAYVGAGSGLSYQ